MFNPYNCIQCTLDRTKLKIPPRSTEIKSNPAVTISKFTLFVNDSERNLGKKNWASPPKLFDYDSLPPGSTS